MITMVNFLDLILRILQLKMKTYVSDSDPDSDITVSAVNSDKIPNFGDESGESGIGGEHRYLQLVSLQSGMPLCIP